MAASSQGARTARAEAAARASGGADLAAIRAESRHLYWSIGLFSVFVNALMLTGPLYMLQVYDRVLSSRSFETLVALTSLVAFLYLMMGLLDFVRGRVAARIGARFQARLDERLLGDMIEAGGSAGDPRTSPAYALREAEGIRAFITSPVLMAFYDLPFTPLFLAAIFMFHPWMGLLALGGAVILVGLAVANRFAAKRPNEAAAGATARAERWSRQIAADTETVRALGMRGAVHERWRQAREAALDEGTSGADRMGGFTTGTKTFRLFLQSAMLGMGALLVLRNELTPGAMIAGSILLGRALQPIELIVGQWQMVERARSAWAAVAGLLGSVPKPIERTPLPRPEARLKVEGLTVLPPGTRTATLRSIGFELPPGSAMGVIGLSGAGKTTLARAVIGAWPAAGGTIRLGGATLSQYDPDVLGRLIGYLPQQVRLFEGTVAENIARMDPKPDAAGVMEAARRAAAHEMILDLPDGYETRIGPDGGDLSGGQLQRIGLARAFYGDPVLLVLDEPNSNLDAGGSAALNVAIRQARSEGRAVIVIAHRPAAIEACDLCLMLEDGRLREFGPTREVLAKVTQQPGAKKDAGPQPVPDRPKPPETRPKPTEAAE